MALALLSSFSYMFFYVFQDSHKGLIPVNSLLAPITVDALARVRGAQDLLHGVCGFGNDEGAVAAMGMVTAREKFPDSLSRLLKVVLDLRGGVVLTEFSPMASLKSTEARSS